MKKIIFAIALLFTITGLYSQKTIVNDANAEPRAISGSFSAIKVSGGIDVYLSQSDAEALAVSASEDRFKAAIKTVVENGTLNIYYESNKGWTKGNRKLKVYVSFKNIERIEASGASDVHVAGSISASSLSIEMSGASDFKGSVNVNTLTMEMSGASDAKISGTASNVTVQSGGASDVKGYDLITDYCTARASGASDINITVNKELNAHASGASDIFYKGSAVVKDLQSSGASSVGKR